MPKEGIKLVGVEETAMNAQFTGSKERMRGDSLLPLKKRKRAEENKGKVEAERHGKARYQGDAPAAGLRRHDAGAAIRLVGGRTV